MTTFFHSGDLGDIIACLPAIRAMGGGEIRIGPAHDTGQREDMTEARFRVIAPLLEVQPYINSVTFGPRQESDFDFSQFRRKSSWKGTPENLAEWQGRFAGVEIEQTPWLTVPYTNEAEGRFIMARTNRQRNPVFPWVAIAKRCRERALFIGNAQEHHDMVRLTGVRLEFRPTANLLHAAQLIRGATRGFYNSSAPFWIALGLGTPAAEEVSPNEHIVEIIRPNITYIKTVEESKRFLSTNFTGQVVPRTIILSAHGPENTRTQFAEKTWANDEYHHIKVLNRDARDIGDERGTYYVKDILDFSLSLSGSIFVYINNDVALVPEWKDIIVPPVKQFGCAFSHRLDVDKFSKFLALRHINQDSQRAYCGADLIAFTPDWWREHRADFPDVVLGLEGWDFAMQWLMRKSGFRTMKTVCYHEKHNSFWARPDVLAQHPAQKICRERLVKWAQKVGADKFLWAPGGYLFKSLMTEQ